MFHYKNGLKEYTANHVQIPADKDPVKHPLYAAHKNNAAYNFFGIYILDKVHKMQNLQSIKFSKNNVKEMMTAKYDGVDIEGCEKIRPFYKISREILEYLETNVYACPYWRQDDGNIEGKLEEHNKRYLKRIQSFDDD